MLHLIEQIQAAEQQSRLLEPDKLARTKWNATILEHTENFLETFENNKTYQNETPALKSIINEMSFEQPVSLEETLHHFKQHIENTGINTTSARFFGFIPTGGLYPAALGDYIAAVSNRYSGNFYCSPGAVRIENKLIRWMCELLGFPENASGNLTSSGSIANLIALITAREAYEIKARDFHRVVVYFTENTHFSVEKSLKLIGLGECVKRLIPVDEKICMRTDVLNETITMDKANGLIPWLIVASAGTTDVGSIDPIKESVAIAKHQQLWLHVDAAYGGFFALTEKGKKQFAGIEEADSITLDPHKSLFLPYGIGAVLIKNHKLLHQAFAKNAPCMQICENLIEELSPCDLSPELTKHFRAMRLWLPLRLFGLTPFRAALNEKILLTDYFYNRISEIPRIQVVCPPQLSIVAFRYIPDSGDVNEFNQHLINKINDDGRVYFSSTRLAGQFYLRMACLNFRTHLQEIDLALDVIRPFTGSRGQAAGQRLV